ncbi:MAG: hypothetical protein MZV65_33075 [Chromatiales bacterium]|nr:hypothetical protein [Chromatiales bacterium]
MAHDVAALSARQGAEVTLTSVFADRQDAGQQARGRARAGRGHRDPRRPGAGGGGAATPTAAPPRCAWSRCEAKIVGGRLEIKNVAGTEEDIPADLIVSAIGQAVDFTGLEALNNGKGARGRRQELPGAGPGRACSSAAT